MGLFEMLESHLLENPPAPVRVATLLGRGAGTGLAFFSCLLMAVLVTTRCPPFQSGFLLGLPALAGLGWFLHSLAFRVFTSKLEAKWSSAHEALLRYGNRSEDGRQRNYDDVREALTALGQMQTLLRKGGIPARPVG